MLTVKNARLWVPHLRQLATVVCYDTGRMLRMFALIADIYCGGTQIMRVCDLFITLLAHPVAINMDSSVLTSLN